MRTCDGCRWCCFAYNVEVPNGELMEPKAERVHCRHECERGCGLHGLSRQPAICRDFSCPYLAGVEIHRPDTFQPLLEELAGDMGNYIPAVPSMIDAEWAKKMIRETRSIPAAFLMEGHWTRLVLPIDRNSDGSWETNELMQARWRIL